MATKKTASRAPSRKAPSKKPTARTLKLASASPGFTVNDLAKSLAWYRDVLGFTVEETWERDGKVTGAELRAGDVAFMIGQDDWMKGHDRKKGEGFRLYCETRQDLDALAQRIEARGGMLDQGPRDEPWGWRDFSLTDPDGFKITIWADSKKR